MKLLVVEDDARIRRMIKTFVADLADEVFECSDGDEAQASYNKHRPDWVLMDITMAGVDGITATERIKAEHPDAKIVIVTAHEGAPLRDAARCAGACGYVLKDDLRVLRQLLKRGHRQGSDDTI